jgi:hypothetical protein
MFLMTELVYQCPLCSDGQFFVAAGFSDSDQHKTWLRAYHEEAIHHNLLTWKSLTDSWYGENEEDHENEQDEEAKKEEDNVSLLLGGGGMEQHAFGVVPRAAAEERRSKRLEEQKK